MENQNNTKLSENFDQNQHRSKNFIITFSYNEVKSVEVNLKNANRGKTVLSTT